MKKINAHKPKNWKIDSATALINSLYGPMGKRTVFGNLGGGPRSEARSCEGYPPEGPKGDKEPKDAPPQGSKCQNGRSKGENGGRAGKIKAQNAKMKGNEGVQSQNEDEFGSFPVF